MNWALDILGAVSSMVMLVTAAFSGVFVANILLLWGISNKIGRPLRPLMKIANLPDELSIPTAIGLLDMVAEHSIVSSYFMSSQISENEVLTYELVTSPIKTIGFIFRYYIPVVIVALGPMVGGTCIALSTISSIVSLILGIIYARLKIKRAEKASNIQLHNVEKCSFRTAIKEGFKQALSMTTYVAKRYAIVLVVLSMLNFLGLFDAMESALVSLSLPLSPQALTLFATYVVNPMTGVLMAGEMLKSFEITVKETLLSIVLGDLFFRLTQDFPRHAFPFYVSMYPAKVAIKLTLLGIITVALSTPLAIALVLSML